MDTSAAGTVPASDEGRHATGDGPWWAERWWFGWCEGIDGDPGALSGGFVELVLFPNQRSGWYRAAWVRPGEPLLAIVDHGVPLPRVGLELRADGLWADHTIEAPLAQWTIANEAFALAVEDPDELTGRAYGVPTPLALDAEWYADRPAVALTGGPVAGYTQDGGLEGTVELGGGRRVEVRRARAWRSHTWGPLVLPDAADVAPDTVRGRVPDRWPTPFDAVVEDVLTAAGWLRRFVPGRPATG